MKLETLEIQFDGTDCFVVANGIRIAKRGTESSWISLEPGWAVYSPSDHDYISVTYNGVCVAVQ